MTKEEIEYHNRLWYYKTYNALIEKALNTKYPKDVYTERHHILPKCMGGSNESNNIVRLDYRRHIIAHMLLQRAFPEIFGLLKAVMAMLTPGNKLMNRKNNTLIKGKLISTRMATFYREEFIKGMIGHKTSDETRRKISESQIGKKLKESTKKKIGDANRNPSEETRKRMSEGQKGREDLKEWGEKVFGTFWLGKSRSKESREKMRLAQQKRRLEEKEKGIVSKPKRKLPRRVLDPEGRIFSSVTTAGRFYMVNRETIKNWINKRPEKGFDYNWEDLIIDDNYEN